MVTIAQLLVFITGVLTAVGGLIYFAQKSMNIDIPTPRASLWLFAAFAHGTIVLSVTAFALTRMGS